MDYIIEKLSEKDINILYLKINDIEVHFIKNEDKIFFIKELRAGERADFLTKYCILLSDITDSEQFLMAIKEQLSEKDIDKVYKTYYSMLWDLYVVGIHKVENEMSYYTEEERSEVERNKFFAKKILIEGFNDQSITDKLVNTLHSTEELENIIEKNGVLSDKMVLENILKSGGEDSISIEGIEKLEDLKQYLDDVKIEVEDVVETLNRGESL